MNKRPTPALTRKRTNRGRGMYGTRFRLSLVFLSHRMSRKWRRSSSSVASAMADAKRALDEFNMQLGLLGRKLIPTDHVFRMKQPRCPICGGQLLVECNGWVQETSDPNSAWLADTIDVSCEHLPDFESDEFDAWHAEHYRQPYVDWLPIETRILTWLQKRYRFDMNETAAPKG